MYQASSIQNFEKTLHQLASSEADLSSFRTEAQGYVSGSEVPYYLRVRWNREFIKKMLEFMDPEDFFYDWIDLLGSGQTANFFTLMSGSVFYRMNGDKFLLQKQ